MECATSTDAAEAKTSLSLEWEEVYVSEI